MINEKEFRDLCILYAYETGSRSFIVTKHPSYIAIKAMGKEAVPFLLKLLKEYDEVNTFSWWDRGRGVHYGMGGFGENRVDPWMLMHLLFDIMGDEGPVIPEEIRGRLEPLVKLCLKWGETAA